MLPTVFLSLSGADAAFVGRVHSNLPDGLAYFYPKSFENGESLITAMEERVGKATMFVLFASKASLASVWVGFEVDRARVAKIKDPTFRIIVVPIDKDVTHSDLPEWMREFWTGSVGYTPRDVARYIRRALINGPLSHLPGAQIYGRGPLIDTSLNALQDVVLQTEQSPNVLIISGNAGIGRRTFERGFLSQAFPASPSLIFGPQFLLPQFADVADLYRALRQEIDPAFSVSGFTEDLRTFQSLDVDQQVSELVRNIEYFSELGQAVTLVTGNGIFEDRGFLKPWVPTLFSALNGSRAKVVVISNRLLHDRELRPHTNVMQVGVPPLNERDVRSLMISSATTLGVKPELPSNDIIRSIGGHPRIAKAMASLVARRGAAIINSDFTDLFDLQDDILGESLDLATRTYIEKDCLSVLSWVPQLNGEMLKSIILDRHSCLAEAFADAMSSLLLSCLVETVSGNYLISSPVRALFRRKHGYGSSELRTSFSLFLKEAWAASMENDELRAELLDAIVYMTALEGGSLPPEFSNLLLPSTLQEVVRDTYDRGHNDPDALKRVCDWGLPAKTLKMDETTREEILSYVVRAQTRLEDSSGAEETLAFIDKKSYRSRYYLRSFYVRYHLGDYRLAITLLRKARDVRKYTGRVVADLGLCYQRLGMWPELHQLVKDEEQHIGRNPVFLDVRIGMLIAQQDYPAAEDAIRHLKSLPREDGRADSRTAMIMMRRDQDYGGAKTLLTSILQKGTGGIIPIRRLRAIAAASSGDLETASSDAEFLKSRKRNYNAHDIIARIKLYNDDFDGADAALDSAKFTSMQDELLRARVMEARSNFVATPLAQREILRQKANEIRVRYRMVDEYEVEGS